MPGGIFYKAELYSKMYLLSCFVFLYFVKGFHVGKGIVGHLLNPGTIDLQYKVRYSWFYIVLYTQSIYAMSLLVPVLPFTCPQSQTWIEINREVKKAG